MTMKKAHLIFILLSLCLILFSCSDDFSNDVDDININGSGNVDFSTYIALGNSLTSGYQDGALYKSGQQHSFPAMLAQSMGMSEFNSPLMNDELGGIPDVGFANKYILASTEDSFAPVIMEGTASNTLENIYQAENPIHNLGVPGAKVKDLIANGYGNPMNLSTGTANPYYVRFASTPNASVLEDAKALNPTFFSLWIGANDILGYATSGGDGSRPLTNEADFANDYKLLVEGLVANGAKGVLANLPNVTSIPFFTTVPFNSLDPKNETLGALIPALNQSFGALNQVFDALQAPERKIVLSETEANPVLIKDESLVNLSAEITTILQSVGVPAQEAALFGMIYGQARQASNDDLLLLTSASYIGTVDTRFAANLIAMGVEAPDAAHLAVAGVTYPLEDQYVLTKNEIAGINTTTEAFNQAIENLAASNGLAFYDAKKEMITLATEGMRINGVDYSASFITGGAFSLDGVHPNQRGYAIIANGLIEAINTKYGSALPKVNPSDYTGITFP